MSRSRLSHELPTRNSPLSRSRSRRGSEFLGSIHDLRLLAGEKRMAAIAALSRGVR